MKKITAYQTEDGAVHTTYGDAKRHADKRYGDELCTHARAIARLDGNYQATVAYLEAQTGYLAALALLKSDRDTVEDEA